MYAFFHFASYFGNYEHELLRYNVTDRSAVSLSSYCMHVSTKEKADILFFCGGIT